MQITCTLCAYPFTAEKFKVFGVPTPAKEDLDQIKQGNFTAKEDSASHYALAGITCPNCQIMYFMPANAAIEQGLEPQFLYQRTPDWEL